MKERIQQRKEIFQKNVKSRTIKNAVSRETPRFNSKHSKKGGKKESDSGKSIGDSSSDGMVSAELVFIKGEVFPAEEVVHMSPKLKRTNHQD